MSAAGIALAAAASSVYAGVIALTLVRARRIQRQRADMAMKVVELLRGRLQRQRSDDQYFAILAKVRGLPCEVLTPRSINTSVATITVRASTVDGFDATIAPRRRVSVGRRSATGVLTNNTEFDARYESFATQPEVLAAILSPAVQRRLVAAGDFEVSMAESKTTVTGTTRSAYQLVAAARAAAACAQALTQLKRRFERLASELDGRLERSPRGWRVSWTQRRTLLEIALNPVDAGGALELTATGIHLSDAERSARVAELKEASLSDISFDASRVTARAPSPHLKLEQLRLLCRRFESALNRPNTTYR